MKSYSWKIREARKADVGGILALIRELAIYEKAGDEVDISEEDLLRDGFSEEKYYSAIVAVEDSNVLGVAIYYPRYSTWKGKTLYLEDLVVTAPRRGEGIGKALFSELVNVVKDFGAARLEWQVLDWNEKAISFYKKLNAQFDDEWLNCKFDLEQIRTFKQREE